MPAVCLVGPMVGRHPGRITTQGEALADRLRAAGADVVESSSAAHPLRRLVEIAATVRRHAAGRAVVVECYGLRSFVTEDVATRLARPRTARLVVHLHGGAMPDFMRRFPRWSARVLARADALVVPSTFLLEALAGHGFEATVIPNGLDLADYRFRLRAPLRPRLLWMRSFHPIYDPALAVHVLARVRARVPGTTLVMAGYDKGLAGEMRALAARLGVAGALRLPGFLDAEGKRRELDAADVFVNTNLVDNAPVAVLEAAAAGLPVVATAVGGVPHLLADGRTALLVPPGDAEAMAAAVLRLLDDPALAVRLSRGGRALAEAHDWAAVTPRWLALLAGGTR